MRRWREPDNNSIAQGIARLQQPNLAAAPAVAPAPARAILASVTQASSTAIGRKLSSVFSTGP